MKQFQKLFALLFIISIFIGVVHQLEHDHPDDGTCEICILAHAPALLNDTVTLPFVYRYFEPFEVSFTNISYLLDISLKNRSPPIF